MTSSALIDLIINYTDNVSASDADNATRRLRVLQALQEIFDQVWNFREWRFRLTNATVTVLANGNNVVVPSDFQDFGEHGAVYDSAGRRLVEVTPQQLLEYRETGIGAGAVVNSYALFDFDSTTGLPLFQVPNSVGSANTNFKFWYNKTSPTLGDSTTPSTSKLHFIPAQYHNTVLLAGVIAKIRKVKGDTRDWASEFQQGLAYMTLRERPRKPTVHQVPKAIPNGQW